MLKWLWQGLSETGSQGSLSGRALSCFCEDDIDRLVRSRVLTERSKADTWGVCSTCNCGINARPIRSIDGKLIATCPLDATEDIQLDCEDLRRFVINADRLVEAIAISGGFTRSIEQIVDGLWFAGRSPQGFSLALCPDSETLKSAGAIIALKTIAGDTPLVVITPAPDAPTRMRFHEAGLRAIDIDSVIISDPSGTERLATELIRIPAPLQLATARATEVVPKRLTISRSRRTVCLDSKVFIPSPAVFACVLGAALKVVSGQVLLTHQELYELTNRTNHRDVIKELRDQLEGLGLSREICRAFVKTIHGRGVTIDILPEEIEIVD